MKAARDIEYLRALLDSLDEYDTPNEKLPDCPRCGEDEAFIGDCWERQVYPRGWSAADELTVPPEEGLFAEE